jgi:hypothetical protein
VVPFQVTLLQNGSSRLYLEIKLSQAERGYTDVLAVRYDFDQIEIIVKN